MRKSILRMGYYVNTVFMSAYPPPRVPQPSGGLRLQRATLELLALRLVHQKVDTKCQNFGTRTTRYLKSSTKNTHKRVLKLDYKLKQPLKLYYYLTSRILRVSTYRKCIAASFTYIQRILHHILMLWRNLGIKTRNDAITETRDKSCVAAVHSLTHIWDTIDGGLRVRDL